ncbi:MAG: hypothetical protein COW67_03860 [Flavobacteriales bacterium CG18_big_fil_WC_8_21_14_2_50_32_9]|nr:MAG: hypothetical protein COW67_03860 [Flavobacteriales bacterium CG18_big_fil_WC_8_21_14_2_50_32_9]
MEDNTNETIEDLAYLSEQLLKINEKMMTRIANIERKYLKMEVYLITLQQKLQEVKKRTPEQEKHLLEITNIMKGL